MKSRIEDNKSIGVYCIYNKINGKKYIGGSVNIGKRIISQKSNLNNKKEKSCAPLVFRIFRRNMGCGNRKKSPRMMTACMNWPGSFTHTPSRRATRKRPSPISWRPRKDIRWKTSPSAPSPIYGWRRASPWKNRNCSRISVL